MPPVPGPAPAPGLAPGLRRRAPTRPPPLLALVLAALVAVFVRPAVAAPYTHLTYAQVHFRLAELAKAHPDLVTLSSAQKDFALPHVGNCTELRSSTDTTGVAAPCTIWIIQLTNHTTLPKDPTRAEIFVSGEVHGDEVVGPLATLAFIETLVSRYGRDPFATRLVDTRLITLIPMTNAVGFHRRERFERQTQTASPSSRTPSHHPKGRPLGRATTLPNAKLPDLRIDPNRDFPYDQPTNRCLRTVAARALNELFLRHMFRIVITFHGGTNALAYEWGDSTHCNFSQICPPSPDRNFMHALAERMTRFAGPAGKFEPAYPIGDMGRLVYPVHGGMEDWAYGAGWTSGGNVLCRPDTLGGYAREVHRARTGDMATKRAATYLVEMGLYKRPPENTLGDSDAVLKPGSSGDGHVPRNVRLLLAATDAVEPYVAVEEAHAAKHAYRLRWRVGGAFSVDGTLVQWSTRGGTNSGEGPRQTGLAGVPHGGANGTVFEWALPRDVLAKWGDDGVYCRAVAVVDQALARHVDRAVPNLEPQSHVMGGRASKSWNFRAGDRRIVGRFIFYSHTVLVRRVAGKLVQQRVVGNATWGEVGAQRLHARADEEMFDELLRADGGGLLLTATSATGGEDAGALLSVLAAGGAGLVGFALLLVVVRWCALRKQRMKEAADIAAAFSLDEEDQERIALRNDLSASA